MMEFQSLPFRRRLFAVLLLCLATEAQIARPKFDTLLTFSDNANSFAKDFFKSLGTRGNTITSPLSIFTTMSMTSAGAQGQTRSQILRSLNLSPEPLTRSSPLAYVMSNLQPSDDSKVTMEVANFIWVPMGVSVKADFARTMQDVFQTKVRTADFSRAEEVRQLVNNRVSNATRGKIPQLLPRGAINAETQVLLANAVYFKGSWLHPFDVEQTRMEPFFYDAANSRSSIVPMMHLNDTFRGAILDDLDAKAVFLPYENNRYGLLLLLPNRRDGLKKLENDFFKSNYTTTVLMQKMIHRDVDLTIPKFQIKFQTDVSNVLQWMGVTDLFSDNADLSALTSAALRQRLRASGFFHEATLDVNEGGSEASGASGLEITPLIGSFGYIGPIEFKADHPFLFFLIDEDNVNLPVFMGRVLNPADDSQSNDVEPALSRENVPNAPVAPVPVVNRNRPNPSSFPKFIAVPQRNFRPNFDEVIFPQTRSDPLINFHRIFNVPPPPQFIRRPQFNPNRRVFADDLFFSPSTHEVHNPMIHPPVEDDEPLESTDRKKRETVSPSSPAEEDTIELRGDKFWFKKPQLPELQIPINESKQEEKKETPPPASKPQRDSLRPAAAPAPPSNPPSEVNVFGGSHWKASSVFDSIPQRQPGLNNFPPSSAAGRLPVFLLVPINAAAEMLNSALSGPELPPFPNFNPAASPILFPGLANRIRETLNNGGGA